MKSASIGGAAVSALASLSSSGTDATSGHSSLPPKGFFPPVQFAELEAEYQRTHAVKINSLSKAKGTIQRRLFFLSVSARRAEFLNFFLRPVISIIVLLCYFFLSVIYLVCFVFCILYRLLSHFE